jgi:Ser/Thr protein kinase RdoA (MazF antagonist)
MKNNKKEDVVKIFQKYNNSKVINYKRLGGYSNQNYKVKTNKGIYFLKFYEDNYSEKQIREAIKQVNKASKIYIPKMHFNKLGNKKMYSIMNYINSQSYSKTNEEIENAAIILAKFHKDVKHIKPKNYKKFEINKFKPHYGNLKEDFKIRKYKKIFHSEFRPIKSKKQWIHRDFSTDNVLFKNKKVVGIIDFDVIGYGSREYDLVHGIISFSVDRTKKDYKFNLEIIKQFIQVYKREIKSTIDFKKIYLYMMYMLLKDAINHSNEYKKSNNKINILICRYNLKLLDELHKNKSKIKLTFMS